MNPSQAYVSVLETLSDALSVHPVRGPALCVAVDGRSGVGKTTFAQHLVETLKRQGRPAIGVSLDGFHHPRAHRYARGRYSAEGYYRDARDLDALIALCLRPLGEGGTGRFATASFDLERDMPLAPNWRDALSGQVVVMEGTFLFRPELDRYWDARVFLHAPKERARQRGMRRDAGLLGDEAEALYCQRYEGAYALYETEANPEDKADWRIDMTEFVSPHFMD